MAIEWAKVEEKPDKAVKVVGQYLLDTRKRIETLEAELEKTKGEKEQAEAKVNSSELRIETLNAELEDKIAKNKELSEELDSTKSLLNNIK
ncbi:MAG: hypothetical protein ACFFCM_08605, partial [Promethearchaeota archaeon]